MLLFTVIHSCKTARIPQEGDGMDQTGKVH